MKRIKNIAERLKICWLVMTSHTYYTFFVTKSDDENINGKVRGCYVENPTKFTTSVIIDYLKSGDLSDEEI